MEEKYTLNFEDLESVSGGAVLAGEGRSALDFSSEYNSWTPEEQKKYNSLRAAYRWRTSEFKSGGRKEAVLRAYSELSDFCKEMELKYK